MLILNVRPLSVLYASLSGQMSQTLSSYNAIKNMYTAQTVWFGGLRHWKSKEEDSQNVAFAKLKLGLSEMNLIKEPKKI